mmetsp:Transcript_21350/g.59361  ORF Transcript_21350/g.59361 Transcript_21350/m.59361 type:complete len:207 (-) Transcript_21350:167-787(-)
MRSKTLEWIRISRLLQVNGASSGTEVALCFIVVSFVIFMVCITPWTFDASSPVANSVRGFGDSIATIIIVVLKMFPGLTDFAAAIFYRFGQVSSDQVGEDTCVRTTNCKWNVRKWVSVIPHNVLLSTSNNVRSISSEETVKLLIAHSLPASFHLCDIDPAAGVVFWLGCKWCAAQSYQLQPRRETSFAQPRRRDHLRDGWRLQQPP